MCDFVIYVWFLYISFWYWFSFDNRIEILCFFLGRFIYWVYIVLKYDCVGYENVKNYVCKLRWFLIDVWWMFIFWINYYVYWKWNYIVCGIIKMIS